MQSKLRRRVAVSSADRAAALPGDGIGAGWGR